MAKHYTKLIIEINEDITSKVTAVKGDVNSRFLDVQLFNDSVTLDLTSHTVTMSAKSHPDSNFKVPINKFIDGQITEAINGRCQFKLETDILGQAGVIILQISVFSGEQEVLSTNPFNLYVIDSPRNDEQIEASNEFGALVVLFSEIQNALDDMNAIRENFGTPSQESIEEGILTFWGIIEQMRKDVASAVAYDLPEKVGNPEDTSDMPTVFGKIKQNSELLQANLGGEKIFDISGPFEFTVPENVINLRIIAVGGGGGGGYYTGGSGAGGGGGGADCVTLTIKVDPKQKITGTIGTGGNGYSSDGYTPSSDGTSTVIDDIVTVEGGKRAIGSSYGEATGTGGRGGIGGSYRNDRMSEDGQNGLYGYGGLASKVQDKDDSGGGGGSYGNGGDGGLIDGDKNGKNGTHGGGGGGGTSGGVGGNGGDGIVIFRWGIFEGNEVPLK